MGWSYARFLKYTMQELVALEAEACKGKSKQRIEEIRYAIADKLKENRAASGDPVVTDGYSGRQSKRRR